MARKASSRAVPKDRWYYWEPGQPKPSGPMKADALRTLLREGRLHSQTKVWKKGLFAWQYPDAVKELSTEKFLFRLAFPTLTGRPRRNS